MRLLEGVLSDSLFDNNMKSEIGRENVGKYLRFLAEEGWSELIDERWKKEVLLSLKKQFHEMTDAEWETVESIVFA